MPVPTNAILRPDLRATFAEFDVEMQRQAFIATRVFPAFDVGEKAGHFGRIPIEALLQDPETSRGPKGHYNRSDYKFDQETWACRERGWEEPVDDELVKQYRYIFDAEQVAAMRAQGIILRAAEKRVADAVFNTTAWNSAALKTAVTNEWDDATNATPVEDVDAAKKKVRENSGLMVNAVIMDWQVFQNLRNVDSVLERIKYSGHTDPKSARLTPAVFAELFDVEQVIVAGLANIRNSANPGQNKNIAPIWSNEFVMVCRVATSNDLREPCIGRTFNWSEDSEVGGIVEEYREEQARGSVIRVRHNLDEKRLYVEAGHLLENITT